MSSLRSIDPYTTRYVSLGSGPRERASSCGCSSRTASSSSKQSSCYTRLQKDPPLLCLQRKKAEEAMHRNDAPLVKILMREPTSERMLSRTPRRRPFSAATCSQKDRHQHPEPASGGLIAVKGKNVHWQARSMGRKASDSFIADRVIESISEATKREVSKLSSFYSNGNPQPLPRPPCPSPEQSETSSESDTPAEELPQDSRRLCEDLKEEESGFVDQEDPVSLEEEVLDQRQQRDLYGALYSADELRYEKLCDLSIEEEQAKSVDVCDLQGGRTSVEEKSAVHTMSACLQGDGKRGSKMCLEFKIPTADDDESIEPVKFTSVEPEIADKGDAIDEKAKNSDCRCDETLRDDKCEKNEPEYSFTNARLTKTRDYKKRPVSAYAVMGSTIKAKTIEFLDDKEISGARLMLSNRTLETMLYMDYLREKERRMREYNEDGGMLTESKSDTAVARQRNLSCSRSTKKIDLPPEIQVTSKPPLPRQAVTAEHGTEAGADSAKRSTPRDDTPQASKKSPSEKLAFMNERRTALARKIIRKADAKLEEKKQQQKAEVSFIWRSIAGIDHTSKEVMVRKTSAVGENRSDATPMFEAEEIPKSGSVEKHPLTQSEPALAMENVEGNADKALGENIKTDLEKNEVLKKKNTENRQNFEHSTSTVGKNLARTLAKRNSDKNEKRSQNTNISIQKHVAFSKEKVSNNHSNNQRILRPTSAVILRYKETMKDNRPKKTRPKSSIVGSSTYKTQTAVKPRPSSAAVQRISARNLPFSGAKVASSKMLDLTVKNAENTKTTDQRLISEQKRRPKQRPVSAPTKTVVKASNVDVLDIKQEEKKISEECYNVLDAFNKKGIKISLDTITRALMPPCETAKAYSRTNLPHSSRLLSKPQAWFNE